MTTLTLQDDTARQ